MSDSNPTPDNTDLPHNVLQLALTRARAQLRFRRRRNNNTPAHTAPNVMVSSAATPVDPSEQPLDHDALISRLYNYMKISEMQKYTIKIFEQAIGKYFSQLTEADFFDLATIYWCNASHLQTLLKYRHSRLNDGTTLKLDITNKLLDHAMASGTTVDKLKLLLVQRRVDMEESRRLATITDSTLSACFQRVSEVVSAGLRRNKPDFRFEKDFFEQNCRIRFWNHDVLVRAFSELGWLTPQIAQIGLNRFSDHVHSRVRFCDDCCAGTNSPSAGYTCQKLCLNEKTFQKWSQYVELTASHGAKMRLSGLHAALAELQAAVRRGENTYWLRVATAEEKNKLLDEVNVTLPPEMWDTITAFV